MRTADLRSIVDSEYRIVALGRISQLEVEPRDISTP